MIVVRSDPTRARRPLPSGPCGCLTGAKAFQRRVPRHLRARPGGPRGIGRLCTRTAGHLPAYRPQGVHVRGNALLALSDLTAHRGGRAALGQQRSHAGAFVGFPAFIQLAAILGLAAQAVFLTQPFKALLAVAHHRLFARHALCLQTLALYPLDLLPLDLLPLQLVALHLLLALHLLTLCLLLALLLLALHLLLALLLLHPALFGHALLLQAHLLLALLHRLLLLTLHRLLLLHSLLLLLLHHALLLLLLHHALLLLLLHHHVLLALHHQHTVGRDLARQAGQHKREREKQT